MNFRTPWQMYLDRRDRRRMSESLMRASNHHHDRMMELCNDNNQSYSTLLEDYVLSHLPGYIGDLWQEDGFTVRFVTFDGMSRRLSQAAMRSGTKCTEGLLVSTNGLYCPNDGGIFVREGTFAQRVSFGDHQWQSTEDVCGHEFGHYVDAVFDYPSEWDTLFHDAYRSEKAKLDAYAAADPREYFATACWICARYPRVARKYIPVTAKYFRYLFAEGEQQY